MVRGIEAFYTTIYGDRWNFIKEGMPNTETNAHKVWEVKKFNLHMHFEGL